MQKADQHYNCSAPVVKVLKQIHVNDFIFSTFVRQQLIKFGKKKF